MDRVNVDLIEGVKKYRNGQVNISDDCARDLSHLWDSNLEALYRMADSWSKIPAGLLKASHVDYGDYDECISIRASSIMGKYCAMGLIVPDFSTTNTTLMIEKAWKLSYCVPQRCTVEDLKNMTGYDLFNDAVCSTGDTDRTMDVGGILSIAIFTIFALLIIASTFLDSPSTHPLLKAFSLYSNGKRLLTFSNNPDQILCFNGIKFISMWWIMSGHSGVAWRAYSVTNDQWRSEWQKSQYSQYIMTAHLAVDSFFYISGFLLGYLYFKSELSRKGVWVQFKAVPKMLLHRYIRLTPAVLMTFIYVVFLFKYSGSGPIFSYRVNGALTEPCRKHWWSLFLYFQNYYNFYKGEELCITPLWYISADMQLFLVAPLVLVPISLLYKRSLRLTMSVLIVLNVLFMVVPILTKLMWRGYDPDFSEYDAQSRLVDYFIGVAMGILLRHKKRFKINKTYNVIFWTISLMSMMTVVMVTQHVDTHYGYVARTLCYSFTRPIWCLALSWITASCSCGYGGIANWLLSSKFMQVGGRLTYCLYLVHGPIVTLFALSSRERRIFSDLNLFYDWCGHFIISMLAATIWTLAFELPILTLEKMIFASK